MSSPLSRIVAAASLLLPLCDSALAAPRPPQVPTGADTPVNPTRLLVKPRAAASREDVAAAHARAGGRVVKDLPQIGWQIVAVEPGRHLAAQALYAKEPAIERADLDRVHRLAYVPNDPYWPYEWHMTN